MRIRELVLCLVGIAVMSGFAQADSGDVDITWYGHAMFTLSFKDGPTVLLDPFEPGLWGMTFPIGSMDGIDVVTASHEHEDHNYVQLATGHPVVLRGVSTTTGVVPLDEEVDGLHIHTVETCHGTGIPCPLADANATFVIEGNGLRIAHLGDLEHLLTSAQVAAIGKVDVLLIPVGGGPTIDATQANDVIQRLEPQVILAMHYETPELGWGIDTVGPFLEEKTVVNVAERSLVVNASALPAEPTVFVLPYK